MNEVERAFLQIDEARLEQAILDLRIARSGMDVGQFRRKMRHLRKKHSRIVARLAFEPIEPAGPFEMNKEAK